MKVSKKLALQIAKLVFALGIVWLLLRSGRLSLEKVSHFVSKPSYFLNALALLAIAYVTNFYRWKVILRLVEIEIPFLWSARLSMLGQFFSTFMPGSVGGDLVKAVYVARRYPGRRTYAVASVLLDRFMGLFALIVLGAIGFVFGRGHFALSAHPLRSLAVLAGWMLVAVSASGLLALVWVTMFPRGIAPVTPKFLERLPMSTRLKNLYDVVLSFQRHPKEVWLAFGLAIFVQALNLVALLIIAASLYGMPPWGAIYLDSFVAASCLGLCLMALPLAPLGLGVGQVAFATMFAILGMADDSFGASVVTGYQLLNLILNLLGAYFYLSYKHEVEV